MGVPGSLVEALGFATREIRSAVRVIPGVRLIEAQAEAGERFLLRQLKRHLDAVDPPRLSPPPPASAPAAPANGRTATGVLAEPSAVNERMRALLSRSVHDTPAESRQTLHEVLVGELVPDEARILSALSDGTVYAMVHIAESGLVGKQTRVLENASIVGRAAGVALPDRVHLYVSHLRRLGLVESGPEDPSLRDEYDILLTDPKLRATIAAIGKGPLGARILRRTVRISDLGRELWDAAQPPAEPDADPADDRHAPSA
jgi:hypothetical protein